MTLQEYVRELILMDRQYGQEEELYPLINMLLRENDNVRHLSIRDVHASQGAVYRKNMLYGYASKPDLAILSEDYDPDVLIEFNEISKINEFFKTYKKNLPDKENTLQRLSNEILKTKDTLKEVANLMLGCVEAKTEINLSILEKEKVSISELPTQLSGELLWYGKVLYTDGFKWYYLEIPEEDKKEIRNEFFNGSYHLDNIKTEHICVEIGHLKLYEIKNKKRTLIINDLAELNKRFYEKVEKTYEWEKEWNRLKYNLASINWRGKNEPNQFL